MKLSANIAIPNVVISPTKRIMSLNKRKNVMRITAKNVTLSTKMWPRMKKFNFVSPLWSEIVTFRDRQNVPLNTDPSVPPGNCTQNGKNSNFSSRKILRWHLIMYLKSVVNKRRKCKFIEMQDCNSSKSFKQRKIAFCDFVHWLQLAPSTKKRIRRTLAQKARILAQKMHLSLIFQSENMQLIQINGDSPFNSTKINVCRAD